MAEVEINPDSSRILAKPKLIRAVSRNDILLSLLHDIVDRDVLAANPNLKAVASMTITPDRIDVAEATARKITVTNIPAVVTDATADIAIGLLLAVARRIVEGDKLARAGVFPGSQSNHLVGAPVTGKTLGIVGCGRIGQAMARRARGFDMRILYYDPRRLSEEEEKKLGLTMADLRRTARPVGFHLAASVTELRDAAHDRTTAIRADEADRIPDQHLARADRRRDGAGAGAAGWPARRRRHRRVRERAEDRARACSA